MLDPITPEPDKSLFIETDNLFESLLYDIDGIYQVAMSEGLHTINCEYAEHDISPEEFIDRIGNGHIECFQNVVDGLPEYLPHGKAVKVLNMVLKLLQNLPQMHDYIFGQPLTYERQVRLDTGLTRLHVIMHYEIDQMIDEALPAHDETFH